MKRILILTSFVFVSFTSFAQITGPTSGTVGTLATYQSGTLAANPSWTISPPAPYNEIMSGFGIEVVWGSAGSYTISFYSNGSLVDTHPVTVTGGSSSSGSPWTEVNGEVYYLGNVGIGNTNPAYKLDVSGTTRLNGNVGIGSSSPSEKLHVIGDIRTSTGEVNSGTNNISLMKGVRSNDNSYEWVGFYSGTTRQGIILYDGAWSGANNSSDEFSITAENGNRLTLNTTGDHIALMPDGSGKVGIGTISPSYPLHVTRTHSSNWQSRFQNGSSNVYLAHSSGYGMHINTGGTNSGSRYGLEVRNANQTHFYVRDDGRVGIGTRSPTSTLHITGTAYDGTPNVAGTQIREGIVELTRSGSTPFIDFQNDVSGTNYDARIILNSDNELEIDGASLKMEAGALNMDDNDVLNVHGFQMKDWDDNTGGGNNKYRLLARDGAFMFYNGGVAIGAYGNGSWTDLADGSLRVKTNLAIGKTGVAAGYNLDVNGAIQATGGNSNFWNTAYAERGSVIAGNGLEWDGNLNQLNVTNAGTDDQIIDVFSLSGTTLNLSLENDGQSTRTVNLAGINTDNQDLSISGNVLSLTNDASTVNLAGYLDNTDSQTLSLTGTDLSVSGGNTVDLSPIDTQLTDAEIAAMGYIKTAGTDNQDLTIAGDILSLTNDPTPVDLSGYLDNTDSQSIALVGSDLSISGGNSIDISSIDTNTQLSDADITAMGYIKTETDNQDLSLSGNILSLTNDATTVDLSAFLDNTDAQDLTISGNILSLTNDATTVDLSSFLDNTDDQLATEVAFTSSSGLVATEVAGALDEINTRISNNDASRWTESAGNISFSSGQVSIGTTAIHSDYALSVGGKIVAEEVFIQFEGDWPDYVFDSKYDLLSLFDLKKYIKENNHLPNVPSAQEVKDEGIEVGEMNRILLEKIEELTLYMIKQAEEIESLREKVEQLDSAHK